MSASIKLSFLFIIIYGSAYAEPLAWRNVPEFGDLLLTYEEVSGHGKFRHLLTVLRRTPDDKINRVGTVELQNAWSLGWTPESEKGQNWNMKDLSGRQISILRTEDRICLLAEVDASSEQQLYLEIDPRPEGGKLIQGIDLYHVYRKWGGRTKFSMEITKPGEIRVDYKGFASRPEWPDFNERVRPEEIVMRDGKPEPLDDVFTFAEDGRIFNNGKPHWNIGPGQSYVEEADAQGDSRIWQKGIDNLLYTYRMDAKGNKLEEPKRVDSVPSHLYEPKISVLALHDTSEPAAKAAPPEPKVPQTESKPETSTPAPSLSWLWIGGGLGSIVVLGWLALRLRRS